MYESTSHSGAQTQQEGGTNDIAERLRRLEDSSRHSSGWGDTLKDLNAQMQRLQGGGGSLEPLSNISGWKLTSGFTDPTLAGGATFVGQGQMLLAGSGITFSKPVNSQFLEIASSGGSGLMNADYVVDAAGHGDYLTLYGAAGALQAAIATGVSKFIWLCTTHTETVSAQEVLPALAANQHIIIASGTRERATITWALAGTTGCMSFPAKNASTSISFKSFCFARTAGTGALIVPAAGGPSIMDIEFEDMDFYKNGSTFDALVGGSLLAAMTGNNLTVRGCTGAGALVIHQLGATSNGLGVFIMEDCTMTLDGINRHSSSTSVDWGFSGTGQIMRNNFISHNSGFRLLQQNYTSSVWHFDNNVVISAYAGICILTGNVQSGSNIHICNNTYQASAAGAQFLQLSSATSNIKNVIVTGNSLDGPGSGTAISTSFINTGALPDSIWLAPNSYRDWTTNFNGFAGGATDNWTIVDSTGASATAPNTVNYLIGTADTSLASAIVVGTTPGGELGGTWASPTVDATHSGSAHHTRGHTILNSTDHTDSTTGSVTAGAVIRGNAAGTAWETLIASSNGKVLTITAGLPTWETPSSGGGGGGVVTMHAPPVQTTWTNQPAALTELFGLAVNRTKIDLTSATTVRLVVNVLTAGFAGAKLRGQYSTDAATWFYLDGATGPEAAIDVTGTFASVTVNLTAGAKADVYLRVIGILGDGAADPDFGLIVLHFDTIAGGASVAPPDAKYVTTLASSSLTAEITRQWLGNYFSDTYPSSANTMDDEFDDTTGMSGTVNGLNARWAWRNQGTSTIVYTKAGYATIAIPSSAAQNIRIIEQTAPVAQDYTIEAKFSVEGVSADTARFGIALIDGTNGDLYTFGPTYNVNVAGTNIEVGLWTNVTTFNAFRRTAVHFGPTHMYLKVVYTNSTTSFTFWVSTDGIGWMRVKTTTTDPLTDAVVVTKVGIFANEDNSTGATKTHCDYFRRTA